MRLMRSFRRLFCFLLAAFLISSLPLVSSAQDSRPRYSRRAQSGGDAVIPADTVISLRMDTGLNSRTSRVGDRFTATVTLPVHVNGRTAIPAGATVQGHVTQVTPARRMSKSGTLAIDFDELVFPDGSRMKVAGVLTSDDPKTRERIDDENRVSGRTENRGAIFVGGGGILGAVLGAVVGGGKGAAVGGVVGAGIGVAGLLLTKGEEAEVPPGTPFGLQLRDALVLQGGMIARDNQPSDIDSISDPDSSAPRRSDNDKNRDPRSRSDNDSDRDPRKRDTTPEVESPRDTNPPRSRPQSDNEVHVNRDQNEDEDSKVEPDAEPVEVSLPLSSPEMIRRAQEALRDNGYYEGPLDGAMSPRTSAALKTYQHENNLPETGDLDPETAKRLGVLGQKHNASTASNRNTDNRRGDNRNADNRNADKRDAGKDVLLANIVSATATRAADGSINILINTQANTGGWRWYGEHVVNGDTLEVFARAVEPTGMVTQVMSKGKIEMTVRDGVQYVRRVVVHGSAGDVTISLDGRTSSSDGRPAPAQPRVSPKPGSNIQSQAEDLLSRYRQSIGLKPNGSGADPDSRAQYNEADMEVLFSLESFANAARLYAGLIDSLQDQESLRSATLALARDARKTDTIMTTSSSRAAQSLGVRWDAIRQEVLKLMRVYNISSADLDN